MTTQSKKITSREDDLLDHTATSLSHPCDRGLPHDDAAERYILREMMNDNPVDECFITSCHRLRELHLRRQSIEVAEGFIDACHDLEADPWQFVDELRWLSQEHARAKNLCLAWSEEVLREKE